MRSGRLIAVTVLVLSSLTLSCGRAYQPYVPDTEVPRMIYMGYDVRNLTTVASKLYNKNVYIEITTSEGVAETGKLIRIGDVDLVMSPGYYYSTEGETTVKVDIEKVIPKDKIIIMKVF
jgi:hypothetical protein